MSYDPNTITYAVSIHFSKEVNELISATEKEIAEITGNDFMIENKVPPHITIGAFHGTKKDEVRLLQNVEDFTREQEPGIVQFKEIGNFNEKVLFLQPEKGEYLVKLNEGIHQLLLPEYEKGENGYYVPEVWFPHMTLAIRLNQDQYKKALPCAQKIKLPLRANVSEISVYQCSPFLLLKSFAI